MGSSVDFLINIQQRMQGSAVTELQKLDQQLNSAKASYKQLEAAAANAAKRSELHGAATGKARDKLKSAADSGDVAAYRKASAGLDKMVAKEVALKAKASDAASALKAQETALTKLADQRGAAKQADELGKKLEAEGERGEGGMRRLTGAFRFLGGPVGRTGALVSESIGKFRIMTKQFGVTKAAAISMAAIVAIAYTKMLEGAYALGAFALRSADAARNTGLTVQALLGGVAAGYQMSSAMRGVADETGIGSDRLLEITRALRKAKVSADSMPNALRAVAIQESALGDTEGTDQLIAQLAQGKTAAGNIAKEIDTKFGGIVQKKMLGLGAQAETLQRHFADLVSGFNIEPLLTGLASLVGLFDENTAAGAAMKDLFHSIFEPLLDAAESSIRPIRRFILGLVIGVRQFELAIDPIASAIATAFDSGPLSQFGDAAGAGTTAGSLLAATLLTMAVLAGLAIALIVLPFSALSKAIDGAGANVDWLKGKWSDFTDWWSGLDFAGLASALIDGLVNGINAGASRVVDAVEGLGDGAISAFKDKFGIHSPSSVMFDQAYQLPAGAAGGIEAGAPLVDEAMDRMIGIPGSKPIKIGGSGGGRSITIEKIEINGVKDAEDILDRIGERVMSVLEGAGIELGADIEADEVYS